MKKTILFGIIGLVIIAGVIIADNLLTDDQGNPVYEYQFILPNGASCDLHWLRPRIQYEMGLFPNAITFISPDMMVGFPRELTAREMTYLSDMAINRTVEVCNKPTGILLNYTFEVNPDLFSSRFRNITQNAKPLYYSDGVHISLFILNQTTAGDRTNLRNELCNMWVETVMP